MDRASTERGAGRAASGSALVVEREHVADGDQLLVRLLRVVHERAGVRVAVLRAQSEYIPPTSSPENARAHLRLHRRSANSYLRGPPPSVFNESLDSLILIDNILLLYNFN